MALDIYLPLEYSALKFQRIPRASVAFPYLRKNPLSDTVMNRIKDVFWKHNVQDHLALTIAHRHFDLNEDEKIVEHGPVSTPWALTEGSSANLRQMGGVIHPKTWAFLDGELFPYEYSFTIADKNSSVLEPSFTKQFVTDFYDVLCEENLEDCLGLIWPDIPILQAPDGVGMEATIGRVSITTEMHEIPPRNDYIETTWHFALYGEENEGELGSKLQRVCLRCCSFHQDL